MTNGLCVPIAIAVSVMGAIVPASGQEGQSFFAGKTIRIVTSADAASTYTTYPQLVSQYLGRFIPGNPTIIVQQMPGAGGIRAANYMAAVAPRDGTVLASVHDTLTMTQVLTPKDVKYDMSKFNWIGTVTRMTSTLTVADTAPATTVEGAKTQEVIVGSTGAGSITTILPTLLNQMYGTKYKIVEGYEGMGQMNMAIARGEVHGRAGSLTSWTSLGQDPLAGHVVHVVQVNLKKDPLLPNTQLLVDLARNDKERGMLEFMSSSGLIGRSLLAPPDVPADRIAILRTAFDAMVRDPEFLADAKKRQHDIDPVPGVEVEAAVKSTVRLPEESAAELRAILGM